VSTKRPSPAAGDRGPGSPPVRPVTLDVVSLIAHKRDGGELLPDDIRRLVNGYLADEMDDAQMAAFLMAGVLNGFSDAEATALTEALLDSGDRVDLSMLEGPTVDKHSTGGVGDTTTLIVAPALAAAGCQVAKLSGRGLGHTGGTLDKLESIPGMSVDLSPDRLRGQVERIGVAVAAAGADLAPADRRLYSLRDVTATVADPALIASSVMSKKLAGGADHILLDVKVGNGAFMADVTAARRLASRCVAIGRSQGRRTGALLTQMSEPLGDAIGNALEVAAAVRVLQGRDGRLRTMSEELAAAALRLTGVAEEAARKKIREVITSGAALEKFRDLVRAQGGAPSVADDPWEVLPVAAARRDWHPTPGWVAAMDTRELGAIAGRLGAGRSRQGQGVDPSVGLEILVRVGDPVDSTTVAARIHAATAEDAEAAARALDSAVSVGDETVDPLPLVLGQEGLEGDGPVPSGGR
jgi:pyrimidine-nucleoside phosphorylase